MKTSASVVTALVLSACRGAPDTTHAVAGVAEPCSTPAWSTPQPLHTADGDAAYIGFARAVGTRRGSALFGGEAVVWRLGSVAYDIVAGWPRGPVLSGFFVQADARARAIPGPPGMDSFRAPFAVADSRGIVHVIWGSSTDTSRQRFDSVDLWSARFDGSGWSDARRVVVPSRLRWNAVGPSLTRASDDRMYLVLPTKTDGIAVVGGDWRGDWYVKSRLRRSATYARIAALDGGGVVLAYVGAHGTPGEPDHNSVFVTRSVDDARTWTSSVRLHHSGPRDAGHWPRLLAAGDSTLYLVWAQLFDPGTNDGEETPDSLLVETSVDRGASWRRIPSLGFRDGLADIDAAVDGVGALHVAAMTVQSTGDRAEIVFARWAGDNWSVGEKVRNAAPPLTLSAVSVDSVFATWTALRSSGGRQIPVTVLSKRGPCRSQ